MTWVPNTAAEATKEIVWLRKILEDLQEKQENSTPLLINNTYAIKLAKNPRFHDRTKHINRYRENPHKRINFTEVRKMLVGDVNSIRRVELGFTLQIQRNTKRKMSHEE